MVDEEKPFWVKEFERHEAADRAKVELLQKLDETLAALLKMETKQAVAMTLQTARLSVRAALDLLANDDKRRAIEDLWSQETSGLTKHG